MDQSLLSRRLRVPFAKYKCRKNQNQEQRFGNLDITYNTVPAAYEPLPNSSSSSGTGGLRIMLAIMVKCVARLSKEKVQHRYAK